MPQLPTAEQLGTRIPQNRGGVVSGNVDFSGYQQLGQTVEAFGANLKDRQDAMNLQKAKAYWQRAKIEADNAFDQDNDFSTYTSRYNEMLQKAEEEAAGLIDNNRMQEAFKQEVGIYRAEGLEQMKDRAFEKERESGLATLDETLTTLRESALRAQSPADRQFAFDAMNDAIAVAEANTYMDADDAQTLRKKVSVDAAIGVIEVQDLKTQKELLTSKKGPAEIIPLDVRKSMLESVENQLIDEQALFKADEIRLEGGDRTERLDKVRAIKDADVRKAAERQVLHDLQQENLAMAEGQADIYDEAVKANVAGTTILQWKSQNPKKWDALTGEQQAKLLTSTPRKTDPAAYVRLSELAAENRDEAYLFFKQNAHRFSDGDIEKWADRLNKPQELDGFLTRTERLGRQLNDAGIKKDSDRYFKALEEADKDFIQFEQTNGRKPNVKEQQELLEGVFDKVIDTAWFNPFSSDKFGFDLTPEQRADKRIQEKLGRFEKVLSDYESEMVQRNNGIPVILSDEEIQRVYENADRLGWLDADD